MSGRSGVRRFIIPFVLGFLLFALSVPSKAAPITFTDESVFLAAAPGLSLESFEGLDPSPALFVDVTGQTLDLADFTVSADTDQFIVETRQGGPHATDGNVFLTMARQVPNDVLPQTMTFVFDAPINAFGINYTDVDGPNGAVTLSTNGGSQFTLVTTPPLLSSQELFFGVIDLQAPFTRIDIASTTRDGDRIGFDEAYYGSVIPEPSGALVFPIGIGIVLGLRRWQANPAGSRH